jgi:hypothetical protein
MATTRQADDHGQDRSRGGLAPADPSVLAELAAKEAELMLIQLQAWTLQTTESPSLASRDLSPLGG